MNIADKAWRLDREIAEYQKKISELTVIILDKIEIGQDTTQDENKFFDLSEGLADLRLERVSLPDVPAAIPMMRCA